MVAKIITTDQTSQYLIGSTDFVVLMADVTLTIDSTIAPGFLADHDGACTLTVFGQAVTFGSAAVIGQTAGATSLASVTVGQDGVVQSLTANAVEILRSGTRIDNDGMIAGGNAAVRYGAGVDGAEMVNAGTIASLLGAGIDVTGAAGGVAPSLFDFINTGRIDAATDGVSVRHESLALTNHGDIIAFGTGIALSDDATLDNTLTLVNTGLVQGGSTAVDATGHADSVANSGTLVGAVLLGEGANLFTNDGATSGPVSAGSGSDTLTNTGVIRGTVDLGSGANAVTNHGRLEAGLTLGAGDDRLLNGGTILGDVLLGDGSNAAWLDGVVFGNLAGGANADSVDILGQLTGAVNLAAGADSLRIAGRIDGDIDMGLGTDTVRLAAGARIGAGALDGGGGADTLIARIDVEDAFDFETIILQGSSGLGVVADAIANTIDGNRGSNEIDGGAGGDLIYGRGGHDTLIGGVGADDLRGNLGNDDLIGGAGADTLKGGRGRDSFAYEARTDSLKKAPDHIVDFDRGRDTVDLTALVGGEISWLGSGRFTRSGVGEARFKANGEDVEVRIDIDGNGKSDMIIVLEGLVRVNAGDFLL